MAKQSSADEKTVRKTENGKRDKKKSRNALAVYLTILFAVAFLLILVSFLIQMRDSNETISQLNESSETAQSNIRELEDEKSSLMTEADDLRQQIEDLETQLAESGDESQTLQQDLDELAEEMTSLEEELIAAESENATLKAELEAAQTEAEDSTKTLELTQRAYELLTEAEYACEKGEYDTAELCLETIESEDLTEYFSEQAAELYAALPDKITLGRMPTTDSVETVETTQTETEEEAD